MKPLLFILLLVFSVESGAAEKYCYDSQKEVGWITFGQCRAVEKQVTKDEYARLRACGFVKSCGQKQAPVAWTSESSKKGYEASAREIRDITKEFVRNRLRKANSDSSSNRNAFLGVALLVGLIGVGVVVWWVMTKSLNPLPLQWLNEMMRKQARSARKKSSQFSNWDFSGKQLQSNVSLDARLIVVVNSVLFVLIWIGLIAENLQSEEVIFFLVASVLYFIICYFVVVQSLLKTVTVICGCVGLVILWVAVSDWKYLSLFDWLVIGASLLALFFNLAVCWLWKIRSNRDGKYVRSDPEVADPPRPTEATTSVVSDMFYDDILFKMSSKKHVLPILWVATPLLLIAVTGLMTATSKGIYWGMLPRGIFVGIPLVTLVWLTFAGWGRRESRSYYVRFRTAKSSAYLFWILVLMPLGNTVPMSPAYIVVLLMTVISLIGVAAAVGVPFFLYKSRNIRFSNRILGGRNK